MHGIIAIDPGARTFATGYDAEGGMIEWGAGDDRRLQRLCAHYDDLRKRWKAPGISRARRYKMRRAGARMQLKVRNLVNDAHRRLARWLCENYRVVLLPEFRTSEMVRKWDKLKPVGRQKRRINSKTARSMLTWAHHRFRQRLLATAREHPSCKVIICDEVYTTRTCGRCGCTRAAFGGKTFTCNPEDGRMSCGFVTDRDYNGARNVLLRYLTLNAVR